MCTRFTSDDKRYGESQSDYMTNKRVNIGLDEDVHTKAKVIAVLQGMTLNDYLEQAINEKVAKDKGVLDKIPK